MVTGCDVLSNQLTTVTSAASAALFQCFLIQRWYLFSSSSQNLIKKSSLKLLSPMFPDISSTHHQALSLLPTKYLLQSSTPPSPISKPTLPFLLPGPLPKMSWLVSQASQTLLQCVLFIRASGIFSKHKPCDSPSSFNWFKALLYSQAAEDTPTAIRVASPCTIIPQSWAPAHSLLVSQISKPHPPPPPLASDPLKVLSPLPSPS